MSMPLRRTSPEVGCSKPAIIRSVVVLPHPDGPSSEKNSPDGMSRSMPSTAVKLSNRFTRLTSCTSPAGTAHLLQVRFGDLQRLHGCSGQRHRRLVATLQP